MLVCLVFSSYEELSLSLFLEMDPLAPLRPRTSCPPQSAFCDCGSSNRTFHASGPCHESKDALRKHVRFDPSSGCRAFQCPLTCAFPVPGAFSWKWPVCPPEKGGAGRSCPLAAPVATVTEPWLASPRGRCGAGWLWDPQVAAMASIREFLRFGGSESSTV